MTIKALAAGIAVGLTAALAIPHDASANSHGTKAKRNQQHAPSRDCTPYNGPFGYYGNPWCEGGWKFAEDYPPGAGRYFDVFDLPQVRRLERSRY